MPEVRGSSVHSAAIALGSNLPSGLGGPRENLDEAVRRIGALGRVVALSSYLATAPEMFLDQPEFVNAALVLETALGPVDLMRGLLAIEVEMGRVRVGIPAKGPRLIDLDLILFDDLVMETADLTVPHPGIAGRGFVLKPLAEIAAGWVHPVTGVTVAEMLKQLELRRRG